MRQNEQLALNINNISFKNLKIRYFQDNDKVEKQMEVVLKDFNFTLPTIKSGEEFTYELATALECKAGTFLLKDGKMKLSGKSKLSADMKPEMAGLDLEISDLSAFNSDVELPLKAIKVLTDIGLDGNKVSINNFKINDPREGYKSEITLKGGLDNDSKVIDLEVGVSQVDSALLDLAVPALAGSKQFNRWQVALREASQGKMADLAQR